MKRSIIGAVAALVLGGSLAAAAVPLAASAHVPTAAIDCSTASVSLTAYDQGATADVTLDGTSEHTGTFGGSYVQSWPLTSDATHTSHELVVHVVSTDGAQYNFDFDQTATGCYTPPPVDVCSNIDGAQATIPPGDVSDGNGGCIPAPVPPAACVLGAPYHETDDNLGTTGDDGISIFSAGDGKATDGGGYQVTGNAQGITSFDWTQTGSVGNGIFGRFIFDLSADGGSAYNSFSGLGTHVDQTTVAGYGSKAVFTGKTLADVGTTWPHNKLVAIIWQTGSSYAKGDGAVLTGFSGACSNKSFVVTPTPTSTPTPTPTPVVDTQLPSTPALAETGVTTGWLAPAGAAMLLLGLALGTIAIIRTRRARAE